MKISRAHLTGNIWSHRVRDIVLGTEAAPPELCGQLTASGASAARAIFFATVMALPQTARSDAEGALVEIDGATALDPGITHRAALEIMGYYGRLPAETLAARRAMILSRAASGALAAQDPAPATLRSDLRTDQVDRLRMEAPHEGYFVTRSYALRHPQFAGGTSDTLTREVFVATDAALVLPYDPKRDRVLLIEQFRMGPYGRGDPLPWVLEPVAGRIDAGETPEETARRECIEEADLPLQRLEHVSTHYCSPGCSTEVFHCFVGLCELPDTGQTHGGLDAEHEDLRRHVLAFPDAMDLTRTGEVNIGPLFALLLWLERERPRLRASA